MRINTKRSWFHAPKRFRLWLDYLPAIDHKQDASLERQCPPVPFPLFHFLHACKFPCNLPGAVSLSNGAVLCALCCLLAEHDHVQLDNVWGHYAVRIICWLDHPLLEPWISWCWVPVMCITVLLPMLACPACNLFLSDLLCTISRFCICMHQFCHLVLPYTAPHDDE